MSSTPPPPNPAQGLTPSQIGLHQYMMNINTHEYLNKLINGKVTLWMFNGKPCTITEFADLAYGDTPQRTQFLLKHSEDNQ